MRAAPARCDGSRCLHAAPGRSCRRRSTAIVRGPSSGVPASGAPSGVGRRSPVPPIVSIVPVGEIDGAHAMVADVADEQPPVRRDRDAVRLAQLRRARRGRRRRRIPACRCRPASRSRRSPASTLRTTWLSRSAMYRWPRASNAISCGMFSDARRRRPAVAGVAALAVAGDVARPARLQIEPADPLVVEIAEVQRAVRADGDAVRIVDLRIGVAGCAGADQRGDDGRGERPGRQERDERGSQDIAAGHHRRLCLKLRWNGSTGSRRHVCAQQPTTKGPIRVTRGGT